MFLALFIRPSPQFDELEFPNQELLEPDGSHDEELELIEGNQLDDELDGSQLDDPLGNQFDDDDQLDDGEENSVDPRTTPTPRPMPNTARTVEIG